MPKADQKEIIAKAMPRLIREVKAKIIDDHNKKHGTIVGRTETFVEAAGKTSACAEELNNNLNAGKQPRMSSAR